MNVEDAIATLARRADPAQSRCMRCTATMRGTLARLAAHSFADGQGFDLTEDEVSDELCRIYLAHPELADRFNERGCAKHAGQAGAPA